MGDLVLRTRVTVARRNLKRVCELSRTIQTRQVELGEYLSLPGALASELDGLWEKSHDLEALVKPFANKSPEIMHKVRSLTEQLYKLGQELSEKDRRATQLRDESSQLFGERKDVDDFLLKSAKQLEPTLTMENYSKNQKRLDALFSEYVDLLRGVALRGAGFGDDDGQLNDLFLIADHLPRLWGRIDGWSWQSLAVPSRQEGTTSSEAFVLRIGFPEWTLWALPFVQHGFGQVFAKKRPLGVDTAVPVSSAALADALATVVTGPAYACAALLLRLDPTEVADPTSDAATRSATILVTLQRIAEAAPDSPVALLTRRLHSEWRDAVTTVEGGADKFDTAFAASSTAKASDWAREVLLGVGPDGSPQRPMWLDKWATITKWAQHLQRNQLRDIRLGDAGIAEGGRPTALALLLDAAWLSRVGTRSDEDAPPNTEDMIAKGAVAKMLEVIRPQTGASDRERRGKTGRRNA